MSRGIYFIGGASASGKSTCTNVLVQEFGVKNVELDGLYNIIMRVVSDESAGKNLTKDIVAFCMKKFIESDASGIFEGGWIDPSTASEIASAYSNRFRPVYCGYPNVDVELRLDMIVSKGRHWLARRDRQMAIDWLNQQVKGSLWYESECKKYGIPFFDFSDVGSGSLQLQAHYKAWHTEGNTDA